MYTGWTKTVNFLSLIFIAITLSIAKQLL